MKEALFIAGLLLAIVVVVLFTAWVADHFENRAPNPAVPVDWPAASTYGRTEEFPVLADTRTIAEQAEDIQKKIDEINRRIRA